jgi:hypothetical protein
VQRRTGDDLQQVLRQHVPVQAFVECQGTLTLRFGNRCTVEANYFFGGSVADTGGVRITGEDHRVFNNYFANLRTDALHPERAAVSFVMGTNTDLGYFQAQRALVTFNTFVDDTTNFALGVEGHPVGTLEPVDCTIANNAVRGSQGPLVLVIHEPTNMRWEGNIMFGADVGLPEFQEEEIQVVDPLLSPFPPDPDRHELARPADSSPVQGAALGAYPFVTEDIEGQARPDAGKDVGADQVSSDPVTRPPLTPSDVGPSWLLPPRAHGGGPGGRIANQRSDARALPVVLGHRVTPGQDLPLFRDWSGPTAQSNPPKAPASPANQSTFHVSLCATASPNDRLFEAGGYRHLIRILNPESEPWSEGKLGDSLFRQN